MNNAILIGRLTKDVETRYTSANEPVCISRFVLAVNRKIKTNQNQEADFISCVAFGKTAEHIQKYYKKGMKAVVTGRIQTGKYTNKDGQTVYTTDVVVEDIEFGESKVTANGSSTNTDNASNNAATTDSFMNIPDGIDEDLPFN